MIDRRDDEEFAKAVARLPKPIACFANGAACPWCGWLHRTVTFGGNDCLACERSFCFGYPDWHEGKDPISYVNFPWKQWDAFRRADLMENWTPTKLLQEIYFEQSERQLGMQADVERPN